MASRSFDLLLEAGLSNLPHEWDVVTIGQILSKDKGIAVGVMYPGDHDPMGIPLIRAGDLNGNRINPNPDFRISSEKHFEYRRTALEGGELLLSLVGNLGQCAVVTESMIGWNVARAIAVIRLSDKSDTDFVRLCLMSQPLQHLMNAWATTTVQATLNLKEIKELPIPWPPNKEREAWVATIDALDDKIELNRRMNQTLESMARAVFRQWFVESAEVVGWKVGKLVDNFNLTMGQSPPGETYNEGGEGIPFFQGRTDFGFRFPTNRVYCTAPTRFAEEGDTLVSVRAPVGDINMATEKSAIGRGVAAVRHKSGSRSYTYYAMHSLQEDFFRFEGEGTVFGSINRSDFENLKIATPPVDIVKEFEKVCFPIDQMIENNEKESRTLASLRDSLLPKLMRGEVRMRVKDKNGY